MKMWSRPGYLAVTGGLTAAGALVAAGADLGHAGAVTAGLVTAWVLQAPSFWRLAGTLARGEPVMRDWVGGMFLRLGGLGVIAVVGATTGLPAADAAVAYVAGLLAQLGLEAVWLFRRQPGPPGAGKTDGRDDTDSASDTRERAAEGPSRLP